MVPSWARSITILTLALTGSLAAGCDDGKGGGGDDECPAFTQITGRSFSATADSLSWTMTLKELPAELTFNQADVANGILEYRWGVHVDPDADGTEDYLVAVSHYADGDEVTGDILAITQQALWATEGAVGILIGDATVTNDGHTFTFTVSKSEDPGLADVTEASGHRFETLYYDGTSTCGDEEKGL